MLRKYAILFGILLAIVLLVIASSHYPGGSQADKNSIGYDWKNNYLSNLFSPKAVNGADNSARPWAIAGVFFLCTGFALFFYRFSKRIPSRSAAGIIKYFGVGSVTAAFLAVTPYHDLMVTISSIGALVSMFYITVFLFKAKLFLLKILGVICLLFFYGTVYIYNSRSYLEILPVMQKAALLITIIWILFLEHFTTSDDFQVRKNEKQPTL